MSKSKITFKITPMGIAAYGDGDIKDVSVREAREAFKKAMDEYNNEDRKFANEDDFMNTMMSEFMSSRYDNDDDDGDDGEPCLECCYYPTSEDENNKERKDDEFHLHEHLDKLKSKQEMLEAAMKEALDEFLK